MDPLDVFRQNNRETRKAWQGPPTDQERQIIYSYACYGATDEDICTVMRMGTTSMYKYFGEELRQGRANAKSKIAQRLYQLAIGAEEVKNEQGEVVKKGRPPNLSALIFLAKIRLGWRETQVIETKETKTNIQIVIPHNGRMPIQESEPILIEPNDAPDH